MDVSDAGAMDAGAHLKNSLVFTLGFLETVIWYWVRIQITNAVRCLFAVYYLLFYC